MIRPADPPPRALVFVLLAVGLAVPLLRNASVFLYPIAGWEDGTQGIARYLRAGVPLLHPYAGFVQVLPNLFYAAATRVFALPALPRVLALAALSVTALIPLAVFQALVQGLRVHVVPAAFAAVFIAALPLGDAVLMSNVDYSIWPMAGVLLLCLFNPVPRHAGGWIGYVAWRALFLTSNPIGLAAVPAWMYLMWARPGRSARWAYGVLLAASAAYLIFGIRPDHPRLYAQPWSIIEVTLELAVGGGLLSLLPVAKLLGVLTRVARDGALLVAGALAAWAAVSRFARGARRWEGPAAATLLFLMSIGITCLLPTIGRQAAYGAGHLLMAARYRYVPSLLWCTILAGAALRQVARNGAFVPPNVRRVALPAALLLSWTVLVNMGQGAAYAGDTRPASAALDAFLRDTAARRARNENGPFRLPRLEPPLDWSIILD